MLDVDLRFAGPLLEVPFGRPRGLGLLDVDAEGRGGLKGLGGMLGRWLYGRGRWMRGREGEVCLGRNFDRARGCRGAALLMGGVW